MTKKAFTLVELLVTIMIIVVLVGLAFTSLSRALETSRRTKCLSNLRQIGMALQSYANENDGRFPLAFDWTVTWDQVLITSGLIQPLILICPADKAVRSISGNIRSYAMNGYVSDKVEGQPISLNGNPLKSSKPAANVVLAADRGSIVSVTNRPGCASAYSNADCTLNHTIGANYVFLDLHAEWLTNSADYWYCIL